MRHRFAVMMVAALGLASALGAAPWLEEHARSRDISPNVGNGPDILRRLEAYPEDRPISFAVVGDTHGKETGEHIFELLHRGDLDFIVHLGDFVSEPTREGHGYFLQQVTRTLGPDGPPMLMVMGNHDVDAESFSVADFESVYGPSSFAFSCAGNLFVILRNALPPDLESPRTWEKELEKTILERGSGARRIFVFMHKPTVDPVAKLNDRQAARWNERMGALGVDYLISGHLHGYGRRPFGGTVVMVSGGGGGRLMPDRSGMFHHTVIIRAATDAVSEEILPVARQLDFAHRAERYLFTAVAPSLQRVLFSLGVRGDVAPAAAWLPAPRGDRLGSSTARPYNVFQPRPSRAESTPSFPKQGG